MLSVRDTGHGIDQNAMKRLFDPYFTTKKSGEGTGLGLAVVHGIVKGCGGAVKVESEPGKGSNFQLFFPRIADRTSDKADLESCLPRGTERVILVDDEMKLIGVVQAMLTRLGYEVTSETDARKALECFRAEPDKFDLVVTDMTMPNMTGTELAGELLRIRPNLPIILCTGFSEALSPDEAKALGIREYLMKPFAIAELARALRHALGCRSALDERTDAQPTRAGLVLQEPVVS
jgi:two-component system cell cycle sensor histidine kinase/response regulator CckA